MIVAVKRYLGFTLVVVLILGLLGIASHQEQDVSGTFYHIISTGEGQLGLSSEFVLIIDDQQVTIEQSGKIDKQVMDSERQVIRLFDKDYVYNYNSGHLSLVRKIGEEEFESIEFVSSDSPMFDAYQDGRVKSLN